MFIADEFLPVNMNDDGKDIDVPLQANYDKECRLENKCFLHNKQFTENEKQNVQEKCTRSSATCAFCARVEKQLNETTLKDENVQKQERQKSGDWKYDDWIEQPFEMPHPDMKRRNLYSISDFDRTRRWNTNCLTSENEKSSAENNTKKNVLRNFREYLVSYQESHGIPRGDYTFAALIRVMGQATGRSLLALLYTAINILPVLEIFLHILRFVLDKMLSIQETKDYGQTVLQYAILTIQLLSVYICLIFIFGFIVLPIAIVIINIIAKLTLYT